MNIQKGLARILRIKKTLVLFQNTGHHVVSLVCWYIVVLLPRVEEKGRETHLWDLQPTWTLVLRQVHFLPWTYQFTQGKQLFSSFDARRLSD